MSICLTNHKLKTSCPVKYEYPNLMLLDFRSQASSCHCKYTRIIENHQRGTSLPDDMEQVHIKMTGQIDNEHLGISFIYHWYSFLLWDASSNVHYGHAVNFHHEWCMAWISSLGISLTHIQTPWSRKIPNLFHIASIHKQKITISTQMRESAMLKACPMTAWLG
jgi:hypothetical protein